MALTLIKDKTRTLRSIFWFLIGFIRYLFDGKTLEKSHLALIWLFCVTGGKFNDWISLIISRNNKPYELMSEVGILGEIRGAYKKELVCKLRRDGFLVFPGALPSEMCDKLLGFAMHAPSVIRPMDGESNSSGYLTLFDPSNPKAVRYDYQTQDLLNQNEIQELISDNSILSIVQEYLGCRAYLDVLSMWWHSNIKKSPDSRAAQYFHFDMDRIKWLKIFIYLTDVGSLNGPHTFVRGSHSTGSIPSEILRRGYVRVSDEEVMEKYRSEDIVNFTGPRGTIIIEDTRGFHKGAQVLGDPRLILQMQFSNSLFGAHYEKSRINQPKNKSMKKALMNYPKIYSQYR